MVRATGLTLLQPSSTTSRIISAPGDITFYSASTSNPILEIDSIPSSLSTKVSTGNTNTRLILAAESSGATSTFTLPSAADISAAVGTASLNVPLGIISNKESYFSGSLQVARGGGLSGIARILVGSERISSGDAYIYLVGDTTYTNYGLGFARGSTGANATSFIDHRGTGDFTIGSTEAANLILKTNNSTRMLITAGGTVAINKTTPNTSFNLDVNGNSLFSGSLTTTFGASFGEGAAGPYTVKINKLISANGALDVNGNTIVTGSLRVTGSAVITGSVDILGTMTATAKSFLIQHPSKPTYKLQYGVAEGPEHSVFVRGRTTSNIIYLPDYWCDLVDSNSITVQLTPIGRYQRLIVTNANCSAVTIENIDTTYTIDCYYFVQAERKDIPKLQVELG
jgi:hypothetical protein